MKPNDTATQHLLKKAALGESDGYELSLSSDGRAFVRINQASSGNAFKLFSDHSYPSDGATWVHLASTYDGATLRIYLDGVLEGTLLAPGPSPNDEPLSIGAQLSGSFGLDGTLDDVHLYDTALAASKLQLLMANGGLLPDADGDGVPDNVDAFPNDPSESRHRRRHDRRQRRSGR